MAKNTGRMTGAKPSWTWDTPLDECIKCNENHRKVPVNNSPLPPGFYGFFDEPSPLEYKMMHRAKHTRYLEDKEWRAAHPWKAIFRKPYDPNQIFWRG